jgi:hypothetical protein
MKPACFQSTSVSAPWCVCGRRLERTPITPADQPAMYFESGCPACKAGRSPARTPRAGLYTAAKARLIIAVKDPAVVAEIHKWKQRCDGVVREFHAGDHPK